MENSMLQLVNMKIQNNIMLDFKRADINGDGIIDNIYLMGNRVHVNEPRFAENISLFIQNGRTNNITRVPVETNSGYDAKLYIDDFTRSKKSDIMISINSGGSTGLKYYYAYTIFFNCVNRIFDYRQFNKHSIYEIIFRDNYKIEIKSENIKKKFWIDISFKGTEYLEIIYDKNGRLKRSMNGYTTGLIELIPIDLNLDGVKRMVGVQKIMGRDNSDILGYINTILVFKKNEFILENVQVGLMEANDMEIFI